MYKKIIFSFLIVGVLLFGISKADVQDVSFRFCDDTDNKTFLQWEKTIFVTPGEEQELCLYFSLSSDTPKQIVYGFTRSYLSAWAQVCDADKWSGNAFSKFFTAEWERSFLLKKDEPKIIREKISVPLGMSGIQYGCIAYSLSEPQWEWLWGMFSLIVNKVFKLNLFAGWSADVKSNVQLLKTSWGAYTTNKKVNASIDDSNSLSLGFKVKNGGNVDQSIQFTGKVYNILWFEKNFTVSVDKLTPGEEKEIKTDIGILPFYRWFFTIKFTMVNEPKFDFDISWLSGDIQWWGSIHESAQIYLFSWITFVLAILVIIILIKLFMPRKKVIIQQPIQQ